MKSIYYGHFINEEHNTILSQIEDSGLGKVTGYEEIDEYYFANVMLDEKHNSILVPDADDLLKYALTLTLIDEKEYEDWLMFKILKVKA